MPEFAGAHASPFSSLTDDGKYSVQVYFLAGPDMFKQIGHKSLAMTVKHSHLAPDLPLNVVEKFAAQPADATTDTGTLSREELQSAHMN